MYVEIRKYINELKEIHNPSEQIKIEITEMEQYLFEINKTIKTNY